ncbi:MAG: hydrogenase iron-sulfur subunit [Desulfovibrionales bacterium]
MAEKIGVYICSGCGIGDAIDADSLAEHVQNTCSDVCSAVKTHPFLCGKEGRAFVEKDLNEGELDGIVIGGCSPRMNWNVFDFGPKVIVDRVNLREQCVWSYKKPKKEESGEWEFSTLQKMAQDYMKMGVAKVQNSNPPESEIPEITKRILVLGGGFTGLTGALEAAKAGYEVVLVEKEGELGGFARKMYKKLPMNAPYEEAQPVEIDQLISAVEGNENIKVYTNSTVEEITGQPGVYDLTLKTASGEENLQIGSVILATGWKPYDASNLGHLGYGTVKNVVTNYELEEMAKAGAINRPSDGQKAASVAFIQCAGQRDQEFLPYCSSVCCLTSLKQAKYVRELNGDASAYILYKDMRTPGVYENYYRSAQDDPGIFLTKGDVAEIKEDADGSVLIILKDSLLGKEVELKADMAVLATGMVPTTVDDPVLNLGYRQGPGLPDLDLFYGFADSNYICFPYETRRTGIYSAGCVHQPMLMSSAAEDAAGAALKSIQCLESVNRGMAVHPRSGDLSYPKFNFVRCTQCKRCTDECPFGVLNEDEKGTPQPNTTRCRRCGTCMGACPERVISFDNYSVGQVGAMIRKVEVPDTIEEGGPRALVLCCENDAYPALDMAALRGKKWSSYVRFIPVRCLGSVNTIWVADALGKGVDGVMLLGCKYGDDYQCHFMKGSELCNLRMDNIGETLERLGVEKERVAQKQVAIDEYDKIPEMIDEFLDMLEELGPNPYKGY